jgi:hypothetical protein
LGGVVASTIATIATRIAGDRSDHAATTAANSGSVGAWGVRFATECGAWCGWCAVSPLFSRVPV